MGRTGFVVIHGSGRHVVLGEKKTTYTLFYHLTVSSHMPEVANNNNNNK